MTMLAEEYDVTKIAALGGGVVRQIKICLHVNAIPVETVTGEVVAHLCPNCDNQLD